VLPCQGIGDALLMMIASQRLLEEGYKVTTYHASLHELASWFPGHRFLPAPPIEQYEAAFGAYDLLVAENDNSAKISALRRLFGRTSLSLFYPTYCSRKHPPLSSRDKTFQETLPMADNIALAIAALLESEEVTKNNGLTPPDAAVHRSHPRRILIHPESRDPRKNWSARRYAKTAEKLSSLGYEPVFICAPDEHKKWKEALPPGAALPLFLTLSELALYVYESGALIGNDSLIGHLASNLDVPTLVIADDWKRMQLWRPGWLPGAVLTCPYWVPNVKYLRLRKRHWRAFVTPRAVLDAFQKLMRPVESGVDVRADVLTTHPVD
jgi:hypothetical protein